MSNKELKPFEFEYNLLREDNDRLRKELKELREIINHKNKDVSKKEQETQR